MGNRNYYHGTGLLAIMKSRWAQYPTVAPPSRFNFRRSCPIRCRETVQNTVTQVIEQNMNGIDKMVYMSSTSDSAGSMNISLTFEADAKQDIAQGSGSTNSSWQCRCLPRKFSSRVLPLKNPPVPSCWWPARV
ncbi:efflux RND transporter permease subunit [Shigella flexneri]